MATSLFFVLGAMFELAVLLLVNRIIDNKEIGLKRKIRIVDRNSEAMKNDFYHVHNDDEIGVDRSRRVIDNPWKLRTDKNRNLRAVPLVNTIGKLGTTSKIDLVAFVTFSTGFLVFNVIYYNTYHQK